MQYANTITVRTGRFKLNCQPSERTNNACGNIDSVVKLTMDKKVPHKYGKKEETSIRLYDHQRTETTVIIPKLSSFYARNIPKTFHDKKRWKEDGESFSGSVIVAYELLWPILGCALENIAFFHRWRCTPNLKHFIGARSDVNSPKPSPLLAQLYDDSCDSRYQNDLLAFVFYAALFTSHTRR